MHSQVFHIGVRLDGEGDEAVRRIPFQPGSSLRDILNATSARVRSGCPGIGGCGLCRVRVDAGDGGAPTTAEILHLGEEVVAGKSRLACQIVPDGDIDVTVLTPARPSPWRVPITAPYRAAHPPSPGRARPGCPWGVAVDLGTTCITVAMCDMASGRCVATRAGANPQGRLGADVIGRLDAAAAGGPVRQWLRQSVVEAIGSALLDLSQDEGVPLPGVGQVRVVGNSAMLALLSGLRPEALLEPASWAAPIECPPADAGELAEAWDLARGAKIEIVQPLGGFVGSDLLSGVIHCRLIEGAEPALLIDFGTSSEAALWDGERLWVTAAAGGSALEATGIGCGMGAEPGAIRRLSRSRGGAWEGEVIESGPPRGICGSGLVDLLAILRAGGEVDELGRILQEPLTISVGGAEFTIGKADIDKMQRAKAAIAAGVEVLRRRAGLTLDEIAVLHVAGSLGEHLDVEHATRIGLVPAVPAGRVRLAGNTSLEGALDLTLSEQAEGALALARERAELINLSMEEEFEELFFDRLYIRPATARS